MKGKHTFVVSNRFIKYEFTIKRNITIIQGDSATGKTTLVNMIREYDNFGAESGIFLSCEKKCSILEGSCWLVNLNSIHDSIIFIDEGNSFVSASEFADAVKLPDNYFVIVTRESLPNLPYSVDEIYGIKTSGKYGILQQTYQEFFHIYGDSQ